MIYRIRCASILYDILDKRFIIISVILCTTAKKDSQKFLQFLLIYYITMNFY